MSDVLSVDSGVDSEFDIEDFEDEAKGGAVMVRKGGRKPAGVLRTQIKQSGDPTRPPLMLGKMMSANEKDGFDPQKLIEESNRNNQNPLV